MVVRKMKWLRWEKGRQKSGYDKMLLATGIFPLPFDCYLLRFPEGSEIGSHVDKNDGNKHYRINVIIKRAIKGGLFFCENTIFETGRIKFFRPDENYHAVSKVEKGTRYVLSFGCLTKDVS